MRATALPAGLLAGAAAAVYLLLGQGLWAEWLATPWPAHGPASNDLEFYGTGAAVLVVAVAMFWSLSPRRGCLVRGGAAMFAGCWLVLIAAMFAAGLLDLLEALAH